MAQGKKDETFFGTRLTPQMPPSKKKSHGAYMEPRWGRRSQQAADTQGIPAAWERVPAHHNPEGYEANHATHHTEKEKHGTSRMNC